MIVNIRIVLNVTLIILVEPETLRRERTKPYRRRNHVSAPYQAIENMAASIGRQRPASYQRRQQITVPYQESENPSKNRANSGTISYFNSFSKIYLFFISYGTIT